MSNVIDETVAKHPAINAPHHLTRAVVLRGFKAEGMTRLPGQVVNASRWPNAWKLVKQRYLALLPDDVDAVEYEGEDSRYGTSLVSEAWLKDHTKKSKGKKTKSEDVVVTPDPVEATAEATEPASDDDSANEPAEASDDGDELSQLSKEDLMGLARDADIAGRSNMNRDELEAAVRAAMEGES